MQQNPKRGQQSKVLRFSGPRNVLQLGHNQGCVRHEIPTKPRLRYGHCWCISGLTDSVGSLRYYSHGVQTCSILSPVAQQHCSQTQQDERVARQRISTVSEYDNHF